ncbi:MAG: SDR family NAD(P)-dependent oxidoreductase [Desulfuromonadaceae bacterium]|nr:SDR family oxidoreductase [Geobacteraceae bacterium]
MQKTALITGGNKGIGLESSRYFLARGYKVIALARDFSTFELSGEKNVSECVFDLTEVGQIPDLIGSIGPVDVLVNNAGVMYSLPYDAYPQEKMESLLRLNLEAPVALMREVGKQMVARGGGRIVNNASVAGQVGHPDIWYGISKAGIINATKSFARILGPDGVLVNAVAPSPVETDMLEVIPQHRREAFKESVINKRFATAAEVAEAIGWLGTTSPAYINGICIDINNGAFPR